MMLKSTHQCWEILTGRVMTDGRAGKRPPMLLWVQLRATGREMGSLNMRMLAQIVANHRPWVSFGTIP